MAISTHHPQRSPRHEVANGVLRWLLAGAAAVLLAVAAADAVASEPRIAVTVGGELVPGVYGRVDLSNGPPPPLLYAQPMLIRPMPMTQPPLYLYVPPGHAKHWAKHCARYGACNRPVYFIDEGRWPGRHWEGRRPEGRDWDRGERRDWDRDGGRGRRDDDDRRGNGNGHGHGRHGRD